MTLSQKIQSKIDKQKFVGHDNAAVIPYKMLEEWIEDALQLEQKLNIHSVMQAEGSDVSEGAAVASGAVGQNGSGAFECEHYKSLSGHPFYCNQCNKMIT
jgi:hypothetical protein